MSCGLSRSQDFVEGGEPKDSDVPVFCHNSRSYLTGTLRFFSNSKTESCGGEGGQEESSMAVKSKEAAEGCSQEADKERGRVCS